MASFETTSKCIWRAAFTIHGQTLTMCTYSTYVTRSHYTFFFSLRCCCSVSDEQMWEKLWRAEQTGRQMRVHFTVSHTHCHGSQTHTQTPHVDATERECECEWMACVLCERITRTQIHKMDIVSMFPLQNFAHTHTHKNVKMLTYFKSPAVVSEPRGNSLNFVRVFALTSNKNNVNWLPISSKTICMDIK